MIVLDVVQKAVLFSPSPHAILRGWLSREAKTGPWYKCLAKQHCRITLSCTYPGVAVGSYCSLDLSAGFGILMGLRLQSGGRRSAISHLVALAYDLGILTDNTYQQLMCKGGQAMLSHQGRWQTRIVSDRHDQHILCWQEI